ncbi:YicC/YloC family endoribonuclease [Acidicapsa dinghuensis]|uniref:YicC/YloC family endoribonuclease n=1 Tax=Acidicapsa dinghuensis TaxID=2218256 RepID=A0ABW1EMW0_9BACT|nr:YicC/YloC family endoribonuclease [Acidicapsa dinghuensis]
MDSHTLLSDSSKAVSPVSSMTGFARASVDVEGFGSYTLTLKSVNHRFLDLHLRMPSSFDGLEMELRRVLKENLLRGHVELTLTVDRNSAQVAGLNRELVASYVQAFRTAATEFALPGDPDLNTILRIPGVLQAEQRMDESATTAIAASVLTQVVPLIDTLKTMRAREGASLAAVLEATLDRMTDAVRRVAELRVEVEARYQERLTERMEAALGPENVSTVGRQRIVEEVAVLVERSDVSEEIARMETHIQHFREVLAAGGETGKKLDFLLQEMNREANTLLSKTAGVAGKGTLITELGLAMKAEIEKAREQIQNLE